MQWTLAQYAVLNFSIKLLKRDARCLKDARCPISTCVFERNCVKCYSKLLTTNVKEIEIPSSLELLLSSFNLLEDKS